ncbi:MAG: glutathionylspermidine synthase family protein [Vulcanimicrobiota bacterium]
MDNRSPLQMRQRDLTDLFLFDYYLQSSPREEEIISPYPHYLDEALFREMVDSAAVIYKLIVRIISDFNNDEKLHAVLTGSDFPCRELIVDSPLISHLFFWVRFDAFLREQGGIFFTECNFDKPCGQREILISEDLNRLENRNGDWHGLSFRKAFLDGFMKVIGASGKACRDTVVAVLIDPSHREEMYAAFLFVDLLRDSGCHFIIAGGNNISADEERVYAFGRAVDVILRQYPSEYLYEIHDCEALLRLYRKGRILILNDPHAVIGQAKSIFALCWELLLSDDPYLDRREKEVIRSTLPYTRLFNAELREETLDRKDGFVLKAVFGRYSEQVYIGRDHSEESWHFIVDSVLQCKESYILQEFVPMRPEKVKRFDGERFLDMHAYVNYGVYLIDGAYEGISARCTSGHLTREDSVWFAPLCLRERSLAAPLPPPKERALLWEKINDDAAFSWGFTGGYDNMNEYFVLQPLILRPIEYELIKEASCKLIQIFKKAVKLVQKEPSLLLPLLGIPDSLRESVCSSFSERLTFLGRMDWVFNEEGKLRLLEFNAETPAGLMESMVLNRLIHQEICRDAVNPNENMASLIVSCFSDMMKEFSRHREIRTVGFVSCAYREDWYNTNLLYQMLRHLPFDCISGEISGLELRGEKLALYGIPLDALYRFYPLMWLAEDSYYRGITTAFTGETLCINEPSTLICQSKAFFALLWELARKKFFSERENEEIMTYIPETSLVPDLLRGRDYFVKSYFGMEGEHVFWSDEGRDITVPYPCVYQERVQCQTVPVTIHSTISANVNALYPVIGAYVIGNDFGGIFTRAGGFITDRWAISIPAYVNKRDPEQCVRAFDAEETALSPDRE